ncbi:hypothetical protein VTK56DRAFT_3638 [Thermocarpiscus australiensis]
MTAAATGGKRRSLSEGESDRSSPAPSTRSSNKQQVRHRASIACASCRERRIRCVVAEGETECAQCKRTGATCVIKDDDERRRPISKAYMSSLSNRIALLEEMLRERGVVPPPAVHPPKTRQEAQTRQQQQQQRAQARQITESLETRAVATPANQVPTPPGSGDEDTAMGEPEQPRNIFSVSHTPSAAPSIDPVLLQGIEPKKDPELRRLLCARGNHTFDQSAGRARFFGPTANSHVYANSSCCFITQDRPDQVRRAERVIAGLRPSTHDHLMGRFWEYYNAFQQVVDEAAFETGRTAQDARFYSPFLHMTMLAIGYRFADWDREDVKGMTLGNRESALHRESRCLLEVELERPGGIPSVQALLLLADLEYGVGRDTTGWMYSGMANRLAFDIGLHVTPSRADISEFERHVRRRVMAACVMFDRKWALLLGRPTTIKIQDVGVDLLPRTSDGPLPTSSMGSAAASQALIHRYLFELMELAGKVADLQNSAYGAAHVSSMNGTEDRAYLHFLTLERVFQNWYRRLPEHLSWKPANIKSANMGFFMLHQQFHVCMILLHRPWAKYGPVSLDGAVAGRYPSPASPGGQEKDGTNELHSWMGSLPHHNNRASLSRSMCTQHAVGVARIFWHHRQRFDGRRIDLSAIQHAGTAAIALMAALAHKSAELDHHSNLRYLQVISSAIYDMSHSYQPAARMYHLLRTLLVEIRSEMVESGGFDISSVVSRYHHGGNSPDMAFETSHWVASTGHGSSLSLDRLENPHPEENRAVKRRRLSSHASVDLTCLAPSLLSSNHQGCPTPPGSSQDFESTRSVPLDQVSPQNPGRPGQPTTSDPGFFHASAVDFIMNGTGSPDWPLPKPPPETAENLDRLPTPAGSEDASSSSLTGTDNAALKGNDSAIGPAPAARVDDDTAVERTIEEWLAEPAKPTVLAPPDSLQHSAGSSPGADSSTSPALAAAEQPPPPSLADMEAQSLRQDIIQARAPAPSGSHISSDGTAVCRDPGVMTLEMDLGFVLGLEADTATTPTSATTSSGSSSASDSPDSASSGGNDGALSGIEWIVDSALPPPPAPPPPPPPVAAAADAEPSSSSSRSSTMAPVTLDELVQSVEEAVGSARARARARAAAAAAAGAGAGAMMGPGTGGSGNPNGSAGVAGKSPVLRNRELDFLSL